MTRSAFMVLLLIAPSPVFAQVPYQDTFSSVLNYAVSPATASTLPTGNVNATPTIQAAIDANSASGFSSRTIYFPCGNYRLDGTVYITKSGVRLTGGQAGCVSFIQNFSSGDGIRISGSNTPATGISNVTVDHINLVVPNGTTKSSGAAIAVDHGHYIFLTNNIVSRGFIGFDLRSGSQVGSQFEYHVDNNTITSVSYAGILITDIGNPAIQAAEIYLNNNLIGASGFGYLIQNASGVYGNQGEICCGTTGGVIVSPASGQNVNALYLTKFFADETTTAQGGFNFPDSGGFVTEVHLTDCWGSGSTNGNGIYIANTRLNSARISGFQAHSNALAGINIAAGENIIIDGAQTYRNGRFMANTIPGIQVGGSAKNVTIANSISGYGGINKFNNPNDHPQNYGIVVTGSASYIKVHDNQTFGNATGGIINNSSSNTVFLHDNLSQ